MTSFYNPGARQTARCPGCYKNTGHLSSQQLLNDFMPPPCQTAMQPLVEREARKERSQAWEGVRWAGRKRKVKGREKKKRQRLNKGLEGRRRGREGVRGGEEEERTEKEKGDRTKGGRK